MNLSTQEINQIKETLSKQTPGFLPYDLFIELSKFMVVPIIELIPLSKDKDNRVKVLLLQRDATDPFWPNMLHTPGTFVRTDDNSFKEGFDRLQNEIGISNFREAPKYFKTYYRTSTRSKEVAMCYWVEIDQSNETDGKWFDINDLPENLVDIQRDLIKDAITNYSASSKS